jgi:hypothetical protein
LKKNWNGNRTSKHSINEILSGRQQIAAGKDQPIDYKKNLSLAWSKDLLNIAGEILGILHQKTHQALKHAL